ncbi:unnamed protein product [Moneuplotes crassus]|uniref:Protein kinase domain-containing protein n=1 Tax=Euplotes crassus TaxID=5936 RepID=A0AAD1UF82_EUPCR|nr:unnamed protein product [Moneuplotes crassus]
MEIIKALKEHPYATKKLQVCVLEYCNLVIRGESRLDSKQMSVFINNTIHLFTHRAASKRTSESSKQIREKNQAKDGNQSHGDLNLLERSDTGKPSECWLNSESENKPLYQVCCDGMLFIYISFLESNPKIIAPHLYNLIMKQIMKSKNTEIGLVILISKLLVSSNFMVQTFKQRNASRILISILKKYCFQKVASNEKPSVPDLHYRRAESLKVDYDQISDWSCSYRQGNSHQLSEIAEAHSDDPLKSSNFVDAVNKLTPLEMNNYFSSNRSRIAGRTKSKDLTESQINAEAAFSKFVDQYPIQEEGRPEGASTMMKAHSFAKPVLPLLNIAKVKDGSQNILAIKGFNDITRNQSSRSPHLSVGLSRVGAAGEFNVSNYEAEGSIAKGESSRRDEPSTLNKIGKIANKLGENGFIESLPAMVNSLSGEKYYETFASNKGFLNTQDVFKLRDSYPTKTCSCKLEGKYLLLKGINNTREEKKLKEDGGEYRHNSVVHDFENDKMRLCLLNLFKIFIERFEVSEFQGFFNSHNPSNHTVNLLYCHLASDEINYRIKETYDKLLSQEHGKLDDEIFEGNHKFTIDFDGKIHDTEEVINLDKNDLSNASYIDHLLRGDAWKIQENSFNKSVTDLGDSDIINTIQKFSIFKCSLSSEKVTIFKILQKVSLCSEYIMKMQVESSLKHLSSSQEHFEHYGDTYGLGLSRTQLPLASGVGFASPSKSLRNPNNIGSFDATGMTIPSLNKESQNIYWSNGIAYQGESVDKEKLRKKSDTFLLRITNSLVHKLSNLIPHEISWCEEINKDLLLLSQYINKVHSRISIFQIIDTVLNPLIAIKKILSEIIMRDRKGFHTATGMVQSPFLNIESRRSGSNTGNSPGLYKFRETSNNKRIEQQYERSIREVISLYLDTLSAIFNKCKTQETYRMICEIFIKDSEWRDSVQSYTMFLFKVELMSEQCKKILNLDHKITLTNIEESLLNKELIFKERKSGLSAEEIRKADIDKNIDSFNVILKEICGQARSGIHYYESINTLIRKALQDAKERTEISEQKKSRSQFSEIVAEVGQEYEDDGDEEFRNIPSLEPEVDAENSDKNKLVNYWNQAQKTVLFTYAFLISPTNGIILEYLDNQGINYTVNKEASSGTGSEEMVPTSFLLTTSILKFCETLFKCAEKSLYSKVFTDELVLSFIKIHWVSFLILYRHSSSPETSMTHLENFREEFLNGNTQDFNSQRYKKVEANIFSTKDSLMTLCKSHLRVVCILANNRSESIRKSIFKFKILEFCAREINYECDERIEEEKDPKEYCNTPQVFKPSYELREEVIKPEKEQSYNHSSSSPVESQESFEREHRIEESYGNITHSQEEEKGTPTLANQKSDNSQGFDLNPKGIKSNKFALDLSKVQKKGEPVPQNNEEQKEDKLNIYTQEKHEFNERSSIGRNSEVATIINQRNNAGSSRSSSLDSSSSGLGFVPPPEMNPNRIIQSQAKSTTPVPAIGGLGLKLDLANVPTAHVITQEDKSRQQELKDRELYAHSNTMKIKISAGVSHEDNKLLQNTVKTPIVPPKIPGIGGFGGGFKLNLAKVDTANLITEEDMKRQAELSIPKISKNNFTDNPETKGKKPKKLNLKHKDSTTKISMNESSVPNLKIKKPKRKFKKNQNAQKKTRNVNPSKVSSLVIDNSEASSIFESLENNPNYQMPGIDETLNQTRDGLPDNVIDLTPSRLAKNVSNSNISKHSDISKSDISNGSYVGSNKVFVPSLNIQEDVIEKEEKRKKKMEDEVRLRRMSDKSNPRFQIKKEKGGKNIKALTKSKNRNIFAELNKSNSKNSQPAVASSNSNSESMYEERSSQGNAFPAPMALNLSKVQKKGDPPKVKDNSFFEKEDASQHWDVKPIDKNSEARKELTVTLGQDSKVNMNIPIGKINKDQNLGLLNVANIGHNAQNLLCDEKEFKGIYYDDELHIMLIYLIFSLIITPQKGSLDPLYCSRHPIEDGKPPVLYYLHFHLNHHSNQALIPMLYKKVDGQFCQNSGVRLLKLLCKTLFDRELYQENELIAKGAYGVVYQCKTQCDEPDEVAIKQMKFPKSIENRSVVYDVFSEVHAATIEPLKTNPAVVDVYDYGVDNSGYHIVMKRYKYSLRNWRLAQEKSLNDNLSLYLSLYKEVLKAIELLHSNNITHYDIKADNVFLEVIDPEKNPLDLSESCFNVAIGDLGECKMFVSNEDEFCEKNRGTEVIMSPEMLMLAINIRKDTEKYDRRKRMGTNRLSDIWSLGCLFYELLTGKILFEPHELFKLYSDTDELIEPEKFELLGNNVYLIDFLKFMLIKDPHFRPEISAVIKRFEHVHALLVVTGPSQLRVTSNKAYMTEGVMMKSLVESTHILQLDHENRLHNNSFKKLQNEQQIAVRSIMPINEDICYKPSKISIHNKSDKENCFADQRLVNSLLYCSKDYLQTARNLIDMKITHIISIAPKRELSHLNQSFDILFINEYYSKEAQKEGICYPRILAAILDFMRKAKIRKGKVLFVEEDELLDSTSPKSIVGEYVLLALSRILSVPAYEIYTMIRTRNPIFDISHSNLCNISTWCSKQLKIQYYLRTLPTLECMCGACCIILKRKFGNMSNMHSTSCSCLGNRSFENSHCPSPGCYNFIMYMRKVSHKVKYDKLKWGYLGKEDFILGPKIGADTSENHPETIQRQILAGSLTIDQNCEPLQASTEDSESALTDWVIYRCKYCYVWMYSYCNADDSYAILLNNQIKPNHSGLSRS